MGKKEDTNEKIKDKCFVIMPISDQGDYPVGHFTKIYEQIIKPAVQIQDDKTEKIFDVGEISTVFYKSGRVYEDVL